MNLTAAYYLVPLLQEIVLVLLTFALALVLGVPLGLLCYRHTRLKRPLLRMASVLQKLPTLALFGLFVAAGGSTGSATALWLALLYTVLPIIFATEKGFRRIDRATVDAALGMGLRANQIFFQILLPLASGQIMDGVRKAAVGAVGVVTMATLSGGGLGQLIMDGIGMRNPIPILAGALPACVLALAVDMVLAALERAIVPAPLRRAPKQVLFIDK